MPSSSGGSGRSDVARCWAGFASLGAGLVHVAVINEHLVHWLLAGVFFAVVGLTQLAWGFGALARDRAPYPRAFIGLNLGVIALWAVTRTTGLPFGPDAGTAEAAATSDVLCMVLQGLVVLSLVLAVKAEARESRAADMSRLRPPQLLAGLAVGAFVMAGLTTPALAATEAGEHAHPHFSEH